MQSSLLHAEHWKEGTLPCQEGLGGEGGSWLSGLEQVIGGISCVPTSYLGDD